MLKRTKWLLVIGLFIILSGLTGYAEEWTIYGPKALSMGGAGVASGDPSVAPYWNPAALTLEGKRGLYIPFGLSIGAEGDILASVDRVYDSIQAMDWAGTSAKIDAGTPLTAAETQQLLDLFVTDMPGLDQDGQGILLDLHGGLMFTVGKLGISGNMFTYGAVDPTVSLTGLMSFSGDTTGAAQRVSDMVGGLGNDRSGAFTNPGSQGLADQIAAIFTAAGTGAPQNQAEELVYQAELAGIDTSNPVFAQTITDIASATAGSGASTVTVNPTGITFSGLLVKEIGVSYAKKVMGEKLSVGGTLKFMQGETYYKFIQFDDMEGGDDIVGDLGDKNTKKKSTKIGLDLGALMSVTENFNVGLTARNINRPKFKWAGPGDYELDPQFRLGAAYKFLGGFITVASDYDLTKNESVALDGFESQMFSLGAEVNLLILRPRIGMYKNQASDESGTVYTLGTSLNLFLFSMDIAFAQAADKVDVEVGTGGSEEIRERYTLAFSLNFLF